MFQIKFRRPNIAPPHFPAMSHRVTCAAPEIPPHSLRTTGLVLDVSESSKLQPLNRLLFHVRLQVVVRDGSRNVPSILLLSCCRLSLHRRRLCLQKPKRGQTCQLWHEYQKAEGKPTFFQLGVSSGKDTLELTSCWTQKCIDAVCAAPFLSEEPPFKRARMASSRNL